MLNTLSNWIPWASSVPQDEWNTWVEWQKNQPLTLFEQSDIFKYYLSRRPNFQPPQYSCITLYNNKYYVYCFGDFTALLVNPNGGGNATDFINLLIDVYDVCKGYTRRLTGDPIGIAILRDVINKRSLGPLQNHDFTQYNYPYDVIHAHTVAQYSLSTLLMRLTSHYMSHMCTMGYYLGISVQKCQKTMDKNTFGKPDIIISNKSSSSISIQQQKPKSEDFRGHSWPRDQVTCLRCKSCNRVTENIWGKFDACIDCHLKRICSVCGNQAVIIGIDNFPKCYHHQEP